MAISKKSIPSKTCLKLESLENFFQYSLAELIHYAIQQENRLSDTLDNLNAKLKKAILAQKSNKNTTKIVEKQQLKAQINIDNLELEIALTTDALSLMTKKVDHWVHISELSDSAEVALTKAKAQEKKSAKPIAKVKTQPKKSKTKLESVESFDLSEFFTPDMDFGFVSPSESKSESESIPTLADTINVN